MGITIFDKSDFLEEVYNEFIPGQRYTKKYIKEKLGGELYKSSGYSKTPKSNDLEDWFEISPCKIYDPVLRKQDHGFEIISKKK